VEITSIRTEGLGDSTYILSHNAGARIADVVAALGSR